MGLPTPIGRQRDVLYLPADGHFVVLGTAGSGKTTLAILRSAFLSHRNTKGGGPTLLVTFNRALVAYLKHLHDPTLASVTVENYHRFARGYLASRGKMGRNAICGPEEKANLISEAVISLSGKGRQPAVLSRGPAFFESEIEWIERHGIGSAQEYRLVERVGREAALDSKSRDQVFQVYEIYLDARKNAGKEYDWDDLAGAVYEELAADRNPRRYKHVVIDEGQDFSPQMIRSLATAIPTDGSLTFFGDMAQQIYGRRLSWKSAGLSVAKVWQFKENYRNTRQIAALGLAISGMPYFTDTPDMVEPIAPKADGPLPALVHCDSAAKQIQLMKDFVLNASKTQTVAVLVRRREVEALIKQALPRDAIRLHRELTTWHSGPKTFYGTYHAAKGLEFDTVFLPFVSENHLPDPEEIQTYGVEEAKSGDGKLLYVGVTRAKTQLIMTFSGERTSLLPGDDALYQKQNR
jgi:superfamily I DNA/RNA helicase